MTALYPFLVGALCLLLCNRQRTALATAQLHHYHSTGFSMWAGSDLEPISDDIPAAAHLTDTFHFLCPCATLSALVHAQTTLTLDSANTQGVNELKSLIPKPIQPAQRGVLPPDFSPCACQSHREGKAKHAALRLIQAPTSDSALKVEQRIKGLIILLTLKWDNV